MRKIVYERPDGGVSIVSHAADEEAAWARLPTDAISPRWVDESEIPTDRTYRHALKLDLTHDAVKIAAKAAEPKAKTLEERIAALEAKK